MLTPFGKLPTGKHLEQIKQSPQYKDGNFQNLYPTEVMSPDTSFLKIATKFFSKGEDREPLGALPSVRVDLNSILADQLTLVWFGHSSYLIFVEGKKILVDPVFSSSPSPIQALGKKYFEGSMPYQVEDLPDIDIVLITHDHYDHLDYESILKLKSKAKLFCATLGVGSHLNSWGIEEKNIIEFDWWQTQEVLPGIEFTSTPARHFSGRSLKRFQTLWSSYVLKAGSHKIFIGADSGYDEAFKMIGHRFGPFDIALLECGQYNKDWPLIHMMPEQTVQAAIDLQARVFLPGHWGKFTLAFHAWNDSIKRVTKEAERLNVNITTPLIGQPFALADLPSSHWWEEVED